MTFDILLRGRIMKREIRISNEVTVLDKIYDTDDDYTGEDQLVVYIPITVKEIKPYALRVHDNVNSTEVFYEGTMEQWHAVKKGEKKIVYKHDHYGEYYHNTYTDPEETIIYNNWARIFCGDTNLAIRCLDGSVFDDENKNAENPQTITYRHDYD